MTTVSIDFDGVIHRYSKGWHDGTIYDEPMPGAIEGIKRLQERYAVVVLTSRGGLHDVAEWLKRRGVPAVFDPMTGPPHREFWDEQDLVFVTNRKLPAIAYVDDRAVVFSDWSQMDAQLRGASDGNFGPPCCPGHGRRCEPGEWCCHRCPEALCEDHSGAGWLVEGCLCSKPDLSRGG